jgi:phosphate transport system permease protein
MPFIIQRNSLVISARTNRLRRLAALGGRSILFLITCSSALIILFIFYFIIKDALPFFQLRGLKEFFTSTAWYPSSSPASFGALPIFVGSGLVTLGAILVSVPLGVTAAVCLSDTLPFSVRQLVKPVIEILAAIPSVAFGFFALVVFAPYLQERGGTILAVAWWMITAPVAFLILWIVSSVLSSRLPERFRSMGRLGLAAALAAPTFGGIWFVGNGFHALEISSGANALNVSIILGIMALPTIVSVSEDALQSVGGELREGAYALGATRAETMLRIVIPAAKSGICAAIILGIMRAIGETMVVWMASGNAAQIPSPWFNVLEPVRTLTATIAGEMGEADHVTGSARYHVLFAMALCLLVISYAFNCVSDRIVRHTARIGKA